MLRWCTCRSCVHPEARAMDSLSPVALLLTQALAGQFTEIVEQLHGSSGVAKPEQQVSAVAVD